MRIAVVSDSHDHLENLARVLERIRAAEPDALIHCGDFCAPFVLPELDRLQVPVHGVFGNVDGDRFTMARLASDELRNVTLHGEWAEVEFDGFKVAMNHYPRLAEGLAATGRYDLVAYGHTHEAERRRVGETWLLNPGEILGRKGPPGYALVDTEGAPPELHTLDAAYDSDSDGA